MASKIFKQDDFKRQHQKQCSSKEWELVGGQPNLRMFECTQCKSIMVKNAKGSYVYGMIAKGLESDIVTPRSTEGDAAL